MKDQSMNRSGLLVLVTVIASIVQNVEAQPFANQVLSYDPGTGFVPPHTNSAAVLGEPARENADPQWGTFPVDPFGPAYLPGQILSLGANGSLTVGFANPIPNNPANPYGVDFLVFGNAGFVLTDFAAGITDGTLFGGGDAVTRVLVSENGVDFHVLNPSLAPIFDGFFPTDAVGDFGLPVNPLLKSADFAGKNLAQLRALYGGSGGGTGYDISWAQDALGRPVNLGSVRAVRLEVLSGRVEIDALSVVPEPRTIAMLLAGTIGMLLLRRLRW